jgi:hypothetical protein
MPGYNYITGKISRRRFIKIGLSLLAAIGAIKVFPIIREARGAMDNRGRFSRHHFSTIFLPIKKHIEKAQKTTLLTNT